MERILDTFPEILKYGATGLSALLFFFAFLLLRQQSKRKKPEISILQTIKIYMYVSVGLAIISLTSNAIDVYVKHNQAQLPSEDKKVYKVVGTVKKTDLKSPRDIAIITRFPILSPSPTGEIIGLRVWKGPDGEFPILSFSHPEYQLQPKDLNKRDEVKIENGEIHIIEPIKLLPIPAGGD